MKKIGKVNRVLEIYIKLLEGNVINKRRESQHYLVDERSIQRDIDDIRSFLHSRYTNEGYKNSVVYDHLKRGFKIERIFETKFKNSEILAICKILLDSRAFTKKEMEGILFKIINNGVLDNDKNTIKELINNELFHYIELQHKEIFIDKMWDIAEAIKKNNYIEINYMKIKNKSKIMVKRKLKPVSIIFSEYYFYLTAFIDDDDIRKDFDVINDSFPTIYRLDRIKSLNILDEKFFIPYKDRFQEGEFRKRVQFMYGGKLKKIKFKYKGESIEAVLDKLPTAEIISEKEGEYILKAEVFGKGIDMWLRGQSEYIEVL